MIGWRHSRPASHRGAVVVEFALIFILLVLLLLGAVEFGRAWYVVHMLSSAAREGARVGAMLGGDDEEREAAIRARIGEVLEPAGLMDVTVHIQMSSGYGRPLRVEIERDFRTAATGMLPQLEHLRLRGSAVFNQESP
jgi:hypothetical protein